MEDAMLQVSLLRTVLLVGMIAMASPGHAQAPGLFTGDDDDDDDFFDYWPSCPIELTDRRIREEVRDEGFTQIYLNARDDQRVQVRATQGDWVYLLEVDTCTGSIMYGQRLRPA
jgi:hypothetical protein